MDPRDQNVRTTPPAAPVAGGARDRRHIYASEGWEIDCGQRELRSRGTAVPIGSRAFEILEVLVQSPGSLVTKDDLMARVWSSAIVEDNTLQVHISAIRKALGADRGILKTVSGRGYRLIGTWTVKEERAPAEPSAPARQRTPVHPRQTNIPVAASALVGREIAVQRLQDLLSAYRVVTLTGPGGIGKTVLAAEVARRLFPTLDCDVLLLELVSLSDPGLVPSAVASLLALQLGGSVISAESVARAIGSRRILLVLDNCEHVINDAANLAEILVRACPNVSILATSREVLRIDGEFVYEVPPLDVPSQEEQMPSHVLEHSAVQLFVARTKALRAEFSAPDDDLPMIAAICRHLDGIPLALEFAAARAASLGVAQVAERIDDRFSLLTGGRRTALPRHQTLRAALDWSYELLPESEQHLLRHLAVFPAGFTLEAAAAVVADRVSAIAIGISNLISKSLVTLDRSAPAGRWRLLETIRVYALQKLADGGEREQAARRHAEFFRDLFTPSIRGSSAERAAVLGQNREIDNVRAALEWSFSPSGDTMVGVALVAATVPLFLTMSLVAEGERWSRRGMLALDDPRRGGPEEMQLQAGLGISLMHMHGHSDEARVALNRSLAIAEQHDDGLSQMGLIGMLHMFHLRRGDFRMALDYAKRSSAVADSTADTAQIAFAQSMLGRCLHIMGNIGEARAALEMSLENWSRAERTVRTHLAADHPFRGGVALARTLWLQGYPDQALRRTRDAIEGAEQLGHTVSLMVVLAWAISVFLWTGDLENADLHIDWSISQSESHSVAPFVAVWQGHKGASAIVRGDAEWGVPHLQRWLETLRATQYELLTTEFRIALTQGLLALNRLSEGMSLIDDTIRLADTNGDLTYMPELLRIKGALTHSMAQGGTDEAETLFKRSLELSRRLGTRAWELRTAIDFSALLIARRQSGDARTLLRSVLAPFTEGFGTSDLRAANRLLSSLA